MKSLKNIKFLSNQITARFSHTRGTDDVISEQITSIQRMVVVVSVL